MKKTFFIRFWGLPA